MIKKSVTILIIILAWASVGTGALAYDFWGISVGTGAYGGSSQLTFSGVSQSGAQYVVGGYKYTCVDGTWLGPFPAASPGEGYLASRKSDAQGLFFRADADAARFVVITGSAQYGQPAPEVGTGTRLFGPGDLKIDVGANTYGVGLRQGGLLWAVDPSTTNPEYKIWHNGQTDSIHARDAGTLGSVELNPQWDRVGHSTLPSNSDMASAFYVSGSGTLAGSATVSFENTGLSLSGAKVFAYTIAVPWSVLGIGPGDSTMRASWRPDCGNDILSGNFSMNVPTNTSAVPEPSAFAGILSGIVGLVGVCRKKI